MKDMVICTSKEHWQSLTFAQANAVSHKKKDIVDNEKDDKEIYDMDEFELLLARHQLIQQQLQKVNGKTIF